MQNYFKTGFKQCYQQLPEYAQKQADRAFAHLALDTHYPSICFKCVNKEQGLYSIRINKKGYRALGYLEDNNMHWYWIGGDHNEYERKLRKAPPR